MLCVAILQKQYSQDLASVTERWWFDCCQVLFVCLLLLFFKYFLVLYGVSFMLSKVQRSGIDTIKYHTWPRIPMGKWQLVPIGIPTTCLYSLVPNRIKCCPTKRYIFRYNTAYNSPNQSNREKRKDLSSSLSQIQSLSLCLNVVKICV